MEAPVDDEKQRVLGEGGADVPLSCISGFTVGLLTRMYSALGLAIGNHPRTAVLLGLLWYAAFLPGLCLLQGDTKLMLFRLKTEFFEEFTLKASNYYVDYIHGTGLFPDCRSNSLIFTSNMGSLGYPEFLREALEIEKHIFTQVTEYKGQRFGHRDLCTVAFEGGPCNKLSLIRLLVPDAAVLDNLTSAAPIEVATRLVEGVPFHRRPLLQLLVGSSTVPFPGALASASLLGEWLAGAKSGRVDFLLKNSKASQQFELQAQSVLEHFHKMKGGPLRLTGYLETTITTESFNVLKSSMWLVGFTCLTMLSYTITFLASKTRLPGQSQILVVAISTLLPILGSLAGFGALGYLGQYLNILGVVAPFLVLAQGVDSIFVMVSALKRVGPEADTPAAISQALATGGVAITITSLTSVGAFGIAAFTSRNFPGIARLNYLLAVSIFLSNAGMMVILPGLLALGERRMRQRRCDLYPWMPQPEAPGRLARTLRQVDPGPPLEKFITQTYAVLPETSRLFVGMGIFIFIVLTGAGLAGVSRVGVGMPDVDWFTDGSYVQDFMADLTQEFGGAYVIEANLLLEGLALQDAAYRTSLGGFIGKLNARPDVVMVDCWPTTVAAFIPANATEADTRAAVAAYLANPLGRFASSKAHFHDDGTLEAARCSVFLRQSLDVSGRATQARELVALAAAAELPVRIYHKSFAMHVRRYERIWPETFQTVLWAVLAVLGVLMLVMPPHVALLATANVCCILLALFGLMGFTGLTINANTFTLLIMALGYCVDYTCHVVHAALHEGKPGEPWASRMRCALETRGYDVLHGCMTALLGVMLLVLGESTALRTNSCTCMMILSLGGTFALVTLPALLSARTLFCGPVLKQ